MEEMGLKGVVGTIGGLNRGLGQEPVQKEAGSAFMDVMKTAIGRANHFHANAEASLISLAKGSGANIHETMIAMEKASVNFQLLMEVRNKVISAYEEVMRMSI